MGKFELALANHLQSATGERLHAAAIVLDERSTDRKARTPLQGFRVRSPLHRDTVESMQIIDRTRRDS